MAPALREQARWNIARAICAGVSAVTLCWALLLSLAGDVIAPPTWTRGPALTVLLAGTVGYVTNYLAVKMLFRPLKPARWIPLRWIWRQGLIPARQDELAEKVGEQVGTRLLDADTLAAEVSRVLSQGLGSPDQTLLAPLVDDALPKLLKQFGDGTGMDRDALAEELRRALQRNSKMVRKLLQKVVRRHTKESGLRSWASESLVDWQALEKDFVRYLDKPKGRKWAESIVTEMLAQDIDWPALLMGETDELGNASQEILADCAARWIDDGHLNPLLANFDVQGQVTSAARALDVSQIEEMTNEVAEQHFGAIQVLGFGFGILAGILLVLAG